jgi:hypothetical protein
MSLRTIASNVTMSLLALACSRDEPPQDDGGDTATSGILVTTGAATEDATSSGVDLGDESPPGGTFSPEGESGCRDVAVTIDPVIPTVVLLVDQSGSMTDDFSGMARWDALYDTLMGPGAVVEQLESSVRFGLTLYTSMDGNAGGTCPMLTIVPPALDNLAAIDAIYGPTAPVDETPTGESLALVAGDLAAFAEPGPKAIVLATDGEPDTCATPNPQEGQQIVLDAVQAAYADDIETYVISVGDEVGAGHLQDVANLGVGKLLDDPNPAPYWQAFDAQDLVTAFQEIIGSFVSCTIPIDAIVDVLQQCEGTVLLDDVELECGVDWQMQDESTLELLGDACEALQNGQMHTVEASWPCGVVNIP